MQCQHLCTPHGLPGCRHRSEKSGPTSRLTSAAAASPPPCGGSIAPAPPWSTPAPLVVKEKVISRCLQVQWQDLAGKKESALAPGCCSCCTSSSARRLKRPHVTFHCSPNCIGGASMGMHSAVHCLHAGSKSESKELVEQCAGAFPPKLAMQTNTGSLPAGALSAARSLCAQSL